MRPRGVVLPLEKIKPICLAEILRTIHPQSGGELLIFPDTIQYPIERKQIRPIAKSTLGNWPGPIEKGWIKYEPIKEKYSTAIYAPTIIFERIPARDEFKSDLPLAPLKVIEVTTFRKLQDYLTKWRRDNSKLKWIMSRLPMRVMTRNVCPECHGELFFDKIRDELTCTSCGLTNYRDARFASKWKRAGCGDFYTVPFGKEVEIDPVLVSSFIASEPEEAGDDDITVRRETWGGQGEDDASEAQGIIDGYEGGRYQQKRSQLKQLSWNAPNPRKYYTHYRFCRTEIRNRCRIGVMNLDKHCNYHEGVPNSEECKGCPDAVSASLYQREHGELKYPDLDELSYPKVCFATLERIPDNVHPYTVASDRAISRFLKHVKEILKSWGIDVSGAASHPSVKKFRELISAKWDLRPYVPPLEEDPRKLYKGTPIGDLLEAAPDPGSHALWYLHELWHLYKYAPPNGPDFNFCPTRKNLIAYFAFRRQNNNGQPNYRLGKDYYDKLVDYEVLQLLKRCTASGILYYPHNNQRTDPGALGLNDEEPTPNDILYFSAIAVERSIPVTNVIKDYFDHFEKISSYIKMKRAEGKKEILFSEIGDACGLSEDEVECLILEFPGTLKLRAERAVLATHPIEDGVKIRKPMGIKLR